MLKIGLSSAMPLISTDATVLQTFPYSETSKIARLATRDLGVVSVVAKGARRPKSKFGASLQPLSDGTVQLYFKQTRDLHTLAEFELEQHRHGLTQDLARYSAATALAELVMRFSPQEPHPELFELTRRSLNFLSEAQSADVPIAALTVMWSGVHALGFSPALEGCAVDGRPLAPDDVAFSVMEGGFLCSQCARSRETARLPVEDRKALAAFVSGSMPDAGLPATHAAAHRRLCARFIRHHVAEDRDLKALDFWESGT